ncbi:hypothetical protein Hanom_Chr07g00637121 [Helianthus anomalus]
MWAGTFNYDVKYRGATAKPLSLLKEEKELSKDGFVINYSKIMVGSGSDTYEKGKTALKTWRHFGLSWAFVDPKTPIENGMKFCVCVKEFFPWVRMPLQVVYVNETKSRKTNVASFGFGGGTLSGHLLSGEERFAIEMDGDKRVWLISYPTNTTRVDMFSHKRVVLPPLDALLIMEKRDLQLVYQDQHLQKQS